MRKESLARHPEAALQQFGKDDETSTRRGIVKEFAKIIKTKIAMLLA